MRKIVNINTTSTKEEQLKDLITSIQQVKDSLVNILDEYEEAGEVDKADTLTERWMHWKMHTMWLMMYC